MVGSATFLAVVKELRAPLEKLICACRSAKKRQLHIFVLKAMAASPGALAPDVAGHRFDLVSIDRKVQMAQRHQLLGGEKLDGEILMVPLPERKQLGKQTRNQSKMGLPGIQDIDRLQKLEQILHDMVEAGRLRFCPPNSWSIN
jgi:hypothetical protein